MPYGNCFSWDSSILNLFVISDALAALAYYSIPITLFYFVRRRKDLSYKWIFILFALFIFASGTNHLAEIYVIWYPNYFVEGLIKAVTAAISVTAAALLWPLIPKALALPGPTALKEKNKELKELNEDLESKVAAKVKESRQLAAIVDGSGDSVVSMTLEGRIETWNRGAELMYGYTAAEAVGKSIFILVPEDKIDELESAIRDVTMDRIVEPFDSVRRTKLGETREVSISISPIRDNLGEVIGFSKIDRDIFEKNQLFQKIQDMNEVLQSQQEQLLAASRAKDGFLARLSHELRSPLNIIMGYIELIKESPVDGPGSEKALEKIERNARLELKMVEELLDLSRMISGKLFLHSECVDIRLLVEEAMDSIRFAAHKKEIQLTTSVGDNVDKITGDRQRLQQALWNLLVNAVKFTPRYGRVELEVRRREDEIMFAVKDTGYGIRHEELPFLFNQFHQKGTYRKVEDGTSGLGIGLFIVKQIVEAHGGHVFVESEGKGRGSCFRIVLPTDDLNKRAEQSPVSEVLGPVNPGPLTGVNVLVADDSIDALELVATVLTRAGAKVTTAQDGKEALEIIRRNNINIIVSDINMPQMDGFSFLEETRKIESQQGANNRPAIALTAYSGAREREQSIRSGFQVHLAKPVPSSHLINVISELAKGS